MTKTGNRMARSIALLVHSSDRYELLFQGFEYFFSKHWDRTIPATNYFATEEKVVSIAGFTNIRSGKGEWSVRLRRLLESMHEDYVLYFQEDMWLTKPVNPIFFEELFDYAYNNQCVCIKLHSSDVYKTLPSGHFIEGFSIAILDNKRSGYLMSHQVTLWDRKFLLDQLKKKEHPWRHERRATKRLRKINPVIHHVDCFSENGWGENNLNNVPQMRSAYHTISVNGILNHNISYYLEALEKGQDEHRQYAQVLRYNYLHQLTHDGRPKPRKEDIYQKVKKYIRARLLARKNAVPTAGKVTTESPGHT